MMAQAEKTEKLITDAQLAEYKANGFFITKPLFDARTISGVRADFQRIWDEEIQEADKKADPKAIERTRIRPFISHLEKRSKVCEAFCKHPVFISLSRQLLGPDVDLGWNQAIIKPPSKGVAFAWHQDAQYGANNEHGKNADRERYLDPNWGFTCWVAITKTTIENGTLWAVPGLHNQGLLPHILNEKTGDWECQFDSSKKIPVILEPGQMLIFTKLVPHGSGPNTSNEARMAYQIGYAQPGVLKNDYQIPLLRGNEVQAV